jgi:hypothetical protein
MKKFTVAIAATGLTTSSKNKIGHQARIPFILSVPSSIAITTTGHPRNLSNGRSPAGDSLVHTCQRSRQTHAKEGAEVCKRSRDDGEPCLTFMLRMRTDTQIGADVLAPVFCVVILSCHSH